MSQFVLPTDKFLLPSDDFSDFWSHTVKKIFYLKELKLCWFSAPRWLQTLLYIAMGWAVLFDVSVFRDMSGVAVFLLAAGGISYTVGGIIYIIKKPNLSPTWGFHELFHLFILLGSVFHYLMVLFYVA